MRELTRRQIIEKGLLIGAAAAIPTSSLQGQVSVPQENSQAQAPAKPAVLPTAKTTTKSDEPNKTLLNFVDSKHNLEAAHKAEAGDLPKALTATAPASTTQFARDEKAWSLVKQRAELLYSVGDSGGLAPISIDNSFKYSRSPQDANFFFNHVEDLLGDASSLLDRCLKDRDTWNDHLEKRFAISAELREYFALDVIHKDEVEAGYYLIAARESAAVLNSEIVNQQGMFAASGFIDWLLSEKYSDEELNKQSGQQQLAAWISHLAAYDKPPAGNFVNYTWEGKSDSLPNFAHDAAFITSWHQFYTQLSLLQSQNKAQSTNSEVSGKRVEGYRARAAWDAKDAEFRKRRTQVARDTADLRSRAFTEPGGALNFSERMKPVHDRFSRDYRDALARIFAAQNGLLQIFGYDVPLPGSLEALRAEANDANSATFDACLTWVRDALTWLSAFTQNDQNYVLPISLKRAMTRAAWNKGVKDGNWEIIIPEKTFTDQRHVRLRGVSSFVAFDPNTPSPLRDNSTWQVTVIAPDQGRSYHLDNSQVQILQSTAPPCRLGRVGVRSAWQPPDIVGAVGIKNLSPIGQWKLGISKVSTEGVPITEVTDIYLDLHLSVRSDITKRQPTAVKIPDA